MRSWIIGSTAQCDIVVDKRTVSSRHCRFVADDDGRCYLEDLGSTNGTFVNGDRLTANERVRVTRDDAITLGLQTPLEWPIADEPGNDAAPSAVYLDTLQEPPSGSKPIGKPASAPQAMPPLLAADDSSEPPAAAPNVLSDSKRPPRLSPAKSPTANPPADSAPADSAPAISAPATPLPATPAVIPSAVGSGELQLTARWSPGGSGTGEQASTVMGGEFTREIISIGRESDNDIVLDYPTVSSHHARIIFENGVRYVEDLGSTNGTFLGPHKQKVTRAPLRDGEIVYFGPHEFQVADLLAGKAAGQEVRLSSLQFAGKEMTFGRDPTCDQVLEYPLISRKHARVFRKDNQLVVEDLGSTNGTFVNGQKISGPTPVRPGDIISLGTYAFELTASGGLEKRDYRGNVTVQARDVTIDVPGKRLLENVSLTILPGEFVGLMGPSGAGKTTFMNALNGYTEPSAGQVLINGQDLYEHFDQFRGQIGYVPQDDIIHPDLTVGQALYYTARLRLPGDYSDAEIHRRIGMVLDQLGLKATKNVRIGSPEKKGISGGQRKRVNLAMELLTDPSLLFLDEPTSGLSSEDALTVMKVLRGLADAGKTILLTIHQPSLEVFRLMDNLVLVSKDVGSSDPGRLAYFGQAYPGAVYFFNPQLRTTLPPGIDPSPDEVLRGLSKQPTATWVNKYSTSQEKAEYVDARASTGAAPPARHGQKRKSPSNVLLQWWTLTRRCFTVRIKDTWNTLILMLQAPIIAGFIVLVFSRITRGNVEKEWLDVAGGITKAIFMLSLTGIWFGCSNAAREIIGEWAIYWRERMVNLKIPAYVFSKFFVLFVFCVIQCLVLLTIVHLGLGLKGNWLLMYLVLLLSSMVGVGIGLLVSAVARSSEMAIGSLPLVILPMVILGGVLVPVHTMGLPAQIMCALMPSRWSYESTLLLEAKRQPEPPDDRMKMATIRSAMKTAADTPDMAEGQFPLHYESSDIEDKRYRTNSLVGALVLMAMLGLSTGAICLLLRRRDIH